MKTLYLLRHAKAEPGSKDISDPERALSSRGWEAAAAMGAYMKAKGYSPAFVLSSPSARTKETLELVAKAAGMVLKHRFENTLYLATAEEILRAVHAVGDDVPSVMVVGHNPGMHHIALLLSEVRKSDARSALELKFPTCALAVLRFGVPSWERIAPGEGVLTDFVTPDELPG
jgi:phosphohistidine phosphatase